MRKHVPILSKQRSGEYDVEAGRLWGIQILGARSDPLALTRKTLGQEIQKRKKGQKPLSSSSAECSAAYNFGAGNETRTRDPDLGKVVLYQLSYSRPA